MTELADDEERALRLELMRLDKRLKSQQLVFEPWKLALLTGGLGAAAASAIATIWKLLQP